MYVIDLEYASAYSWWALLSVDLFICFSHKGDADKP